MITHYTPALTARKILTMLGDPDFVLTIGLPASGKSTFALNASANGYTRLSSDVIRKELFADENTQGDPRKVYGVLYGRLRKALAGGRKIIIDNTNLTRGRRRNLVEIARKAGRQVTLVLFDVPVAVCLERNAARSRVVPVKVLTDFAADLLNSGPPLQSEGAFHAVRPAGKVGKFHLLKPGTPLEVFRPLVPRCINKNST